MLTYCKEKQQGGKGGTRKSPSHIK